GPLARLRAVGIAGPNELSADRRGSLPCDSGALRILLVPAARTGGVDGRQPEDLGGIRDARRHRWLEIAAARPFQIDTRTGCASGISCEPALVCESRPSGDHPYRRHRSNRGHRSRSRSCVARGQRQARNRDTTGCPCPSKGPVWPGGEKSRVRSPPCAGGPAKVPCSTPPPIRALSLFCLKTCAQGAPPKPMIVESSSRRRRAFRKTARS